jgi:hypothetical protein
VDSPLERAGYRYPDFARRTDGSSSLSPACTRTSGYTASARGLSRRAEEFGLLVRVTRAHSRSRANRLNATKAAATAFRYADHAELQGNEHPEQEQGSRRTQPDLPMRTLACLLLGAATVGLYHLLPRTRPGPPFRAALLVLSDFILTQGGLSAAIVGLGLVPKGPFHDLLHQVTGYDARQRSSDRDTR